MTDADPTAVEFFGLAERLNALRALESFGARVSILREGEATVNIGVIQEFHIGGIEVHAINGMTLMGLLDSAMCAAALSRLAGRRCATVNMSVQFIKPVSAHTVTATGRVVSRTRDLLFCESWVSDARGRRRVKAMGLIQAI